MEYQKVLDFWFKESNANWFIKNDAFDNMIKERFSKLHEEMVNGKYKDWEEKPLPLLAKIIVLDQFSRNMFRNTKRMFATDHEALKLSKKAIVEGFDKGFDSHQKLFLYLPFEHSEDIEDQKDSVKYFTRLHEENPGNVTFLDYAIQHYKIIERFGRFPHRNKMLDRKSTPEEIEFLKEEGSSF